MEGVIVGDASLDRLQTITPDLSEKIVYIRYFALVFSPRRLETGNSRFSPVRDWVRDRRACIQKPLTT